MSDRDLRLKRLDIESFGAFQDHRITGFGPGLNVIYGPNETGKTTVAQFIKGVLYGWAKKKTVPNDYVPAFKKARSRAGSLVFTDGEGEWALHRGTSNAEPVGIVTRVGISRPDLYEELVSDVDKGTYERVFSIDEDELKDLDADTGLTKLLVAGTGAAMAPSDLDDRLRGHIKDYGRKRADTPFSFPNLKTAQAECERRIADLSDEQVRLARDFALRDELEDRNAGLRDRLDMLEERNRRAQAAHMRFDALTRDITEQTEMREQNIQDMEMFSRRQRVDATTQATCRARKHQIEDELMPLLDRAEGLLPDFSSAVTSVSQARAESDKASAMVDILRDHGCSSDEATEQALGNFVGRRAVRVAETNQAQRVFQECEGQVEAIDRTLALSSSAGSKDSQDQPKKRSNARGAVTFIGFLIVILGLVLGIWEYLTTSTVDLIAASGAIIALTGIALIVIILRPQSRDAIEDERPVERENAELLLEDYSRERLQMVRACEDARSRLEQALFEDNDLDREVNEFLASHGLQAADGDLQSAIGMVKEQRDHEAAVRELERREIDQRQAAKNLKEVRDRVAKILDDEAEAARTLLSAAAGHEEIADHIDARRIIKQRREALDRKLDEIAVVLKGCEEYERMQEAVEELETTIENLDIQRETLAETWKVSSDELIGYLETLMGQIHDERTSVSDEIEENGKRIGELNERLSNAEDDDALERARNEADAIGVRRQASLDDFLVTVIGAALLEKAMGMWKQGSQPEVFRIASQLLSNMTSGRWSGVMSTPEGAFRALDANGTPYDPATLSTSTRQQLYLALRIALLMTAKGVGKGIPIIADDILVHFDDRRRVGAARALHELARDRQVIVLTCHRSVADTLLGIGDDVVQVTI